MCDQIYYCPFNQVVVPAAVPAAGDKKEINWHRARVEIGSLFPREFDSSIKR